MIYLHFLDRELRESVEASLGYEHITNIVLTAVYMNDTMRMSYSHYFETCLYNEQLAGLIRELNRLDVLKCYTSHGSHRDFIESHKIMYYHDSTRYPFYFNEALPDPQLKLERHESSTTNDLFQKMFADKVLEGEYNDDLKKRFREFLNTIGAKAITKAAFKPFLDALSEAEKVRLARKINLFISANYTKRYLGENNYIVTGIDGLKYYDDLSAQKILFDYKVYKSIVEFLIPNGYELGTIKLLIQKNRLSNIKDKLSRLIKSLMELTLIGLTERESLCSENMLKFFNDIVSDLSIDPAWGIEQRIFYLQSIIDAKKDIQYRQKCDCLLLCATREELEAILQFREGWVSVEYGYYMRKNRVDIVLAQVGTGMVCASIIGQKLISFYRPKIVTMVGFCAGSIGDVHLGDVIIADKVYNYSMGKQLAPDKVLSEQESFGLSPSIARKVSTLSEYNFTDKFQIPKDFELQLWEFLNMLRPLRVFKASDLDTGKFPDWKEIYTLCNEKNYIAIEHDEMKITKLGEGYLDKVAMAYPNGLVQYEPQIKTGVMACGCYVQQQEEIFEGLKTKERKTIALDMESFAIAKLAAENKVDYFVVKGVGDFANDHKSFANRFIPFSTYNAYYIALQILGIA